MHYVKIIDNAVSKYPYGHSELRKDNPNISFPSTALADSDTRSKFNVEEVTAAAAPTKLGYTAVEVNPVKDGSAWTQTWTLVAKDADDVTDDEAEAVTKPVQDGYEAVLGIPELVGGVWKQTWDMEKQTYQNSRMIDYGHATDQIEFITENGLEAWQTKVAEIKTKYPKV